MAHLLLDSASRSVHDAHPAVFAACRHLRPRRTPGHGKDVDGVINLHVDDLFGTGNENMERRVLQNVRKDFQVGSEDWSSVTFVGQEIRWKQERASQCIVDYIAVDQKKAIDTLEEVYVEKGTSDNKDCEPGTHTAFRSALGMLNWLQSRTSRWPRRLGQRRINVPIPPFLEGK